MVPTGPVWQQRRPVSTPLRKPPEMEPPKSPTDILNALAMEVEQNKKEKHSPHDRYCSKLNTMARICMQKVINKDNVDTLKSCLPHVAAGTDESCREMNIVASFGSPATRTRTSVAVLPLLAWIASWSPQHIQKCYAPRTTRCSHRSGYPDINAIMGGDGVTWRRACDIDVAKTESDQDNSPQYK